ncbi:hypothetical protein AB0E64_06860 [Streptomyces caelestis]|uniref:Uncharacterized protein n=1 Tax=Streptomyces caelestis TaxID=36816 RepID=A0A7W9H7L8_9ACTN|nr:hypothetical protein [Streptomyces caelestis]MBB5797209.1 hypothetical protein [Streptomyces caelestis]GGW36538.1 hypothetical protein GCM10010320_15020 [Streptomyces caelestis]
MFRPLEYADGATSGEPQGPPNVYVPQAGPPPAYDAYADPAAAHGWQDVYAPAEARDAQDAMRGMGDTRELPPVPVPVPAPGRPGAGRHSRRGRRRGPWHARRVAVAVGAVGAVSAAALIAGLGFSEAPSGGTREGGGGRTGPTAGESPAPPSTGTGRTPTPGTPLVGRPANSDEPSGAAASASPATTASPTPSEPDTDTPSPSAGSPTASTPTTSAPAATVSPPGRSETKPGHGPGGTKRPK